MNPYKEFAFKHITELVEEGIKRARSIPDNNYQGHSAYSQMMNDSNEFQRWADYSRQVIEISTREIDVSIYLNYLRLIIPLQSDSTLSAQEKIIACLKYLIKVLEIISRR